MATTGTSKLNSLYTGLPPGAPLASADLAGLGISADLAVHYVRAGWLTRLTRGVFCRPNDTLALHPSLVLLQRRFAGLHVGGKSALDWYGVRQYVAQQPVLQLCGWAAGRLPEWFTERFPGRVPPQAPVRRTARRTAARWPVREAQRGAAGIGA